MLKFYWPNKGGDWWQWPVKQTGMTIKANSLSMLTMRVRDHLDANGFSDVVIDEDELVHHAASIAKKLDPNCCYDMPPKKMQERRISLSDVIRFTKTIFVNMSKGANRVDQAEADRRAQICSNCPHNISPYGCGSCSGSGLAAATVGLLVGDRKTSFDAKLQACQFCGCFNKAQVWFPISDLHAALEQNIRNDLPENCWKK